ncbi:hypothetical protein CBER1_05213 [Cercospora berteroae]|uniref:IBR domain-containing protein n=1 Tax=Cercospora berteroae TaxID=357750 RepID=A0A2S6BRV2_9PEZI|nr:hypothetical protein CBER1_05213 [Cercospora berteroae]
MCGDWAHVLDEADTATARLIINLQLDDLVSLAACDRANRRGDVPSDGEVARQLYAEELRECLARLDPAPSNNAVSPQSMAAELMQIQQHALRDSQACMKRHEQKAKREAAAMYANGLDSVAPGLGGASFANPTSNEKGKRRRSGDVAFQPAKRLQVDDGGHRKRQDSPHDGKDPLSSATDFSRLSPPISNPAPPMVSSLTAWSAAPSAEQELLQGTSKQIPRVKLPPPRINNGTIGTPFQATAGDGLSNSQASHFQSITFQQPYQGESFEELRAEHSMQGIRYGRDNSNGDGKAGSLVTGTGFGSRPVVKLPDPQTSHSARAFGSSSFGAPIPVWCNDCKKSIPPLRARYTSACADKHTYCMSCVEQRFKWAIADDALFPPRCCRQVIDPEKVKLLVDSKTMAEYHTKRLA